jgi:DNA-binding response OmpR family regulator
MPGRLAVMVEPDPMLAGKLRGVLETCGFSVEVVDSSAASARIADSNPELVLLDIEHSLGDSLCKQIKKKRKQTPVILVSENGAASRRWFGPNPDVVLPKPLILEEVQRQVRQLFHLQPEDLLLPSADLIDQEEDTDVRAAGPLGTFAREHEVLDLRQLLNGRDKQLIDVREQLDRRERQILEYKQASLEFEKKTNGLTENLLGVEQRLLSANERIEALNQEAETMLSTLEAKEREILGERSRATEALAAAAEEARRQRAALEAEVAAQLERLRSDHETSQSNQAEQHRQQLAELQSRYDALVAQATETLKNNTIQVEQAREMLISASAVLGKHVASLEEAPNKKSG